MHIISPLKKVKSVRCNNNNNKIDKIVVNEQWGRYCPVAEELINHGADRFQLMNEETAGDLSDSQSG